MRTISPLELYWRTPDWRRPFGSRSEQPHHLAPMHTLHTNVQRINITWSPRVWMFTSSIKYQLGRAWDLSTLRDGSMAELTSVKDVTCGNCEPPDFRVAGCISWHHSQSWFLAGVKLEGELAFCHALKISIFTWLGTNCHNWMKTRHVFFLPQLLQR